MKKIFSISGDYFISNFNHEKEHVILFYNFKFKSYGASSRKRRILFKQAGNGSWF